MTDNNIKELQPNLVSLTRDDAREHFENRGLKYSDIPTGGIHALTELIDKHLKIRNKKIKDTEMRLSKKIKIKYASDGAISECSLYMNSHYFTQREAISFNNNGFIGFAGWADDVNAVPLIDAFIEWVDGLPQAFKATELPSASGSRQSLNS